MVLFTISHGLVYQRLRTKSAVVDHRVFNFLTDTAATLSHWDPIAALCQQLTRELAPHGTSQAEDNSELSQTLGTCIY